MTLETIISIHRQGRREKVDDCITVQSLVLLESVGEKEERRKKKRLGQNVKKE